MAWWYDAPPAKYWEGLPVGTGRFAAMIHGTPAHELITFNDETLWSGSPYNPNDPEAPASLEKTRALIAAKRYRAADEMAMRLVGRPRYTQQYQAMGTLHLEFAGHDDAADYRRELDMDEAVVSIGYELNGVSYSREILASYPDQVVAVRLTASRPGAIGFTAWLASPQLSARSVLEDGELVMSGQATDVHSAKNGAVPYKPFIPSRVQWQSRLRIVPEGGTVTPVRLPAGGEAVAGLRVERADAVTLVLAGATNVIRWNDISGDEAARTRAYLRAAERPYSELRRRHLADYAPRFGRFRLHLGGTAAARTPTTRRLEVLRSGRPDPLFVAQYVQYARYLLLAAAREGTLAFNNHNIWLDNLEGRWEGRWTLNINLQEAYWPVESTGLPELNASLLDFTRQLAEAGARTAREHFGFRGWTAAHGADIWMHTPPQGRETRYAIFPTAGVWLMQQLFDHYEYNPDPEYLKTIYPLLKGAALFSLDLLVRDPETGWLVTSPSASPENAFLSPEDGRAAGVSMGAAIDTQLIRDLFRNVISASAVLDVDAAFRNELATTLDRLAPHQIGRHGQLQEWLYDFEEEDPTHRHLSHLVAAYPDDDITPLRTPELAKAVERVLERRGEGRLGWSGAWKINLWARLGRAGRAYDILARMLTDVSIHEHEDDSRITPSFEGNQGIQGVAAGVVEMLVQSHEGEIKLLPALPEAWPTGYVTGVRARDGVTLDVRWDRGALAAAELRATRATPLRLRVGAPVEIVSEGRPVRTRSPEPGVYEFATHSGGVYIVRAR